jgi:LEA14-like dessication related protein
MSSRVSAWLTLIAALMLSAGCASLQSRDPLRVTVAGMTPLRGQGMELRVLLKLRVQNPNDQQIDYQGVALQMNVQGKTLASGVSDQGGTIPRFGEAVVSVPVTISVIRIIRQAWDMMKRREKKITYELNGKLASARFGTRRFTTEGEFDLPSILPGPDVQ